MTESWILNGVRSIFAAIDKAVYGLIAIVYEIIVTLSKINLFGSGELSDMARKMYTLLGIIMLFKISFSFITYLVDPEQLTDKSKGAQKIILNVLIVLALIIITPTAFDKLQEAQNAILKDQVIPKFVLGNPNEEMLTNSYQMSTECDNQSYARSDGDYISILVFRPFYQIEEGMPSMAPYCNIGNGFRSATVSMYLQDDIYNDAPGVKEKYTVDYQFFLSTIVGFVVLLVLVSFCFDVAVRSIKLGFLQIIAPVPIISYIDPKSGKDGMFKKWLKEVGKTWADLFVRLFALFFAVYVIKLITTGSALNNIENHKFWVTLFLLLGALIFAKKLPKLIEALFGIKLDSGLTLNPMKKIRDNALGGKAITGAIKGTAALGVGAVAGSVANTASLVSNIRNDGLKKAFMGNSTGIRGGLRAAGTLLGLGVGGVSAGFRGATGAYKNDSLKKGIMGGLKTSVDNRDKRDKEQDAGYKLGTKIADRGRALSGIKTEAKKRSEQAQSEVSRLQAQQNNISFLQQQHMQHLDSTNISALSSVTIDSNGKYSLTDETGKKREINGQTEWSRVDFERLLQAGNLGTRVNLAHLADVMDYVKLQSDRNQLDKEIFTAMKTQKTFTEKDAEANKK